MIEAQAIGTTNGVVPFWMRSNQYGSIPMNGASTSIIGRASKESYNQKNDTIDKTKRFNWGMGIEARLNTNLTNGNLILSEAFLEGRMGPIELKGGRSKETIGLTGDTLLSSGSFAASGNSLGIPKIDLSIPDFYPLPIFGGIIAVKGNFAHGWAGTTKMQNISRTPTVISYLHQKSLYGRIGHPSGKLTFQGGFNHQVIWGNERNIFGEGFTMDGLTTFFYVVTGTPYGNKSIPKSKVGNQIGSIDIAVAYQLKKLDVTLYRQNLYDVGALYYLANLRDGLNGITIKNKAQRTKNFNWRKLLVEYLNTKNQAGEIWSRVTKSGDENYYNNFLYATGWSYQGIGIGSPLITPRNAARSHLVSDPVDFFVNNRVKALHIGLEAEVYDWIQQIKVTYSINYGTYATSEYGQSLGKKRYPPKYGVFKEVRQLSTSIAGQKQLRGHLAIGYQIAVDDGQLLENSGGFQLSLRKKF